MSAGAARKAPYSPEAVQLLRDYRCPYCATSTLDGKGAGRGRKRCTECGATFGIPRRRRGLGPDQRERRATSARA
jgi:DNA-directed RNA polymerase subunit RPC12/RpoP